MARVIELLPYDPEWGLKARAEAERLIQAFAPILLAVHHIGSTAIPGIKAKPTIDLLGEVRDINAVDEANRAMIALGYEPRGEYGIHGRRYFVRRDGEKHTHHVHIFQRGHPEIERHIAFRDYLIAHPGEAQAYSQLKERLAEEFRFDTVKYTDSKTAFVREIDNKAKGHRPVYAPPQAPPSDL